MPISFASVSPRDGHELWTAYAFRSMAGREQQSSGDRAIVSLSLLDAEHSPARFAADLGTAFARHGFAIIAHHGIDPRAIADADAAARAFFALPDAVKRGYHRAGTGGARGYTPFGTEAAKEAAQVDLKEFGTSDVTCLRGTASAR